jgi:hypothetical protein
MKITKQWKGGNYRMVFWLMLKDHHQVTQQANLLLIKKKQGGYVISRL